MANLKFKEARPVIYEPGVFMPVFTVVDGTDEDLMGDMAFVGKRKGKRHDHVLYRSKTHPFVYRFGAIQKYDEYDTKAGYVWSSRPSLINSLFGVRLTEVRVESSPNLECVMAIDADYVASLIPKEFVLRLRTNLEHGDTEIQMVKA